MNTVDAKAGLPDWFFNVCTARVAIFSIPDPAGGCPGRARGIAFSFASTPGELPKTVVPRHYNLTLRPDLKTLTTSGSLTVEIEVLQPVNRIVLNALGSGNHPGHAG